MTATGTVHVKCEKFNGDPALGSVLIRANTTDGQVRDPIGNIVFSGPVSVMLVSGEATFTLPATDSGTLSPTGFTYTAVEQLKHVSKDNYRTVEFGLTTGSTLQLADIAGGNEVAEEPSWAVDLNGVLARIAALEDGAVGAELDYSEDLGPFDAGLGVLLTSPNGLKIVRISVDNDGEVATEIVDETLPGPADIDGIMAWYQMADLSELSNGSAVNLWADSFGNFDALGGDPYTAAPLYATSGINGHPAVRFLPDVTSPKRLALPTTLAEQKPFTMFVVLKAEALDGKIIASSGGVEMDVQGGGTFRFNKANTAVIVSSTSPLVVSTGAVVTVRYDGSGNAALFLDGTAVGTAANDQTLAAGANAYLGSQFDGYIGEVIVYDAALSPTDRQSVESYLSEAWGTP